jgi:hypothetical protein
LNEEAEVAKKQIEKLLEQLRDKSESENFDEEKERILNVQKAMESETLKERIKVLNSENNVRV